MYVKNKTYKENDFYKSHKPATFHYGKVLIVFYGCCRDRRSTWLVTSEVCHKLLQSLCHAKGQNNWQWITAFTSVEKMFTLNVTVIYIYQFHICYLYILYLGVLHQCFCIEISAWSVFIWNVFIWNVFTCKIIMITTGPNFISSAQLILIFYIKSSKKPGLAEWIPLIKLEPDHK